MKYGVIIFIVIGVIGGSIWWSRARNAAPNPLDPFAQCLAEKGVTMYGADSCSHCQKEKKEFGSAFKHIQYVECRRDPKQCLAMNIQGYPTWIFSDGRRFAGEQGIKKLAQESGCALSVTP